MKPKSLKHFTLVKLIQIFLLAIVTISAVMFFAYKEFFRNTVQNKAIEISTTIKAGLTSHMKAGIMDKREYFLEELTQVHNIKSISILRSEAVTKQFGESQSRYERNHQNIANLKEPLFHWSNQDKLLKAVIPYKASSSGNLNCMQCHNVSESYVLGALEIEMDTSEYGVITSTYGLLLISLLIFFAFVIVLVVFNFVEKYISKPLSKIVDEAEEEYKFNSIIDVEQYRTLELQSLAKNLNDFNADILEKERSLKDKNRELEELNKEIESTLMESMITMGEIEEIRSQDVRFHTKRVAKLSGLIGKEYGLSDEDVKLIELTSPLHDIGKIGIADNILLKPAKLSEEEFEIMKSHSTLGYNVLKHSERKLFKTAAQIAYSHHEKYDGSGYPLGLKGDAIPLFARIVAIVDVLDALLCKRVYKRAWSIEEVREFFMQNSGKHFEPKLTSIVLENLEVYAKIIEELSLKE